MSNWLNMDCVLVFIIASLVVGIISKRLGLNDKKITDETVVELRKVKIQKDERKESVHLIDAEYIKQKRESALYIVAGIIIFIGGCTALIQGALENRAVQPATIYQKATATSSFHYSSKNPFAEYTPMLVDIPKDGLGTTVKVNGNTAFVLYADKGEEIIFLRSKHGDEAWVSPFPIIESPGSSELTFSAMFIAPTSDEYVFYVDEVYTGTEVFINVVDAAK